MTVLSFDDIPVSGGPMLVSLPGFNELGYQFSSNVVAIDMNSGVTWAHPFSGDNAAFNDYQGDMIFTGAPFSFQGAWFTGWNTQVVGGLITGYLNGVQVDQTSWSALGPDAGGGHPIAPWNYIYAGFDDVDQIVINSYNGVFLMDNAIVGTPVPEPATFALMLMGFAAVRFWRIFRGH